MTDVVLVRRVKKSRTSAPRSRTGCGTCKIRHKRCDEAKPICANCSKTGRICDGYIDPLTGGRVGGHATAVSRIHCFGPRIPIANEQEAQGFRFFQAATEIQLDAALQNHGWAPPFLQLAHQDPAICHAVIATGIMSKRYQINELFTPWNVQANSLYQSALGQYCKAVAYFRSQLEKSLQSEQVSLGNVAACCVLLIIFEFMQGNADGLLTHLRSAIKLAESVSESPQTKPFSDLLTLFEIIATTWLNLDRAFSNSSIHFSDIHPSQMPLPLHSDPQMLYYDLVNVKNEVMTLHHAIVSVRGDVERSRVGSEFLPTVEPQTIRFRLDVWRQAFAAACQKHQVMPGYHQSLLRANYLVTVLTVDAILDGKQLVKPGRGDPADVVDNSKSRGFYEIVEITEAILENGQPFSRYDVGAQEESLEAIGLLPLFSFRLSFIQPLFYVAQRSPDIQLRRRAVQLLCERPWREGAWDSFIMGSIAKRSLETSVSTVYS
ncbi:hypothetical protein BDV59DRAFT_174590 [Aspergillus ambiguus]|uniref:Zn(II)2Cys6 transcription factor n=1 Tax=Aspergillus ambiguus TaxID=176160 RepID=UPI003CCD357F